MYVWAYIHVYTHTHTHTYIYHSLKQFLECALLPRWPSCELPEGRCHCLWVFAAWVSRVFGFKAVVLNPGCILESSGELSKTLMPGATPRDSDLIGVENVLGVGNFKSSPDGSHVPLVLGTTDFRNKFSQVQKWQHRSSEAAEGSKKEGGNKGRWGFAWNLMAVNWLLSVTHRVT